jgi:hypothetical protein
MMRNIRIHARSTANLSCGARVNSESMLRVDPCENVLQQPARPAAEALSYLWPRSFLCHHPISRWIGFVRQRTKGRDQRPAFDELCKDACGRRFDIVMAWSVDRLGRSLQDLVGFLAELHSLKIDLCLKQGIDTTTPAGKASQANGVQTMAQALCRPKKALPKRTPTGLIRSAHPPANRRSARW